MNKGFLAVVAGGLLVAFGVAWFLFSPLLFDEVIDEGFPEGFPSIAQIEQMSDQEKSSAMASAMAQSAKMPNVVVNDDMSEMPVDKGPEQIRAGKFSGADELHRSEGSVIQYRLSPKNNLIRFENFSVTNGPALVVYLAKHPAPTSADDVREGFVSLGKLKGNLGNQNYSIADNIDVSEYGSVVVWCELFGVLFAAAPLET